jgi:hypothetical protein
MCKVLTAIFLLLVVLGRTESRDLDTIFKEHFKDHHVNYDIARLVLDELKGKPLHVVETGTSAWGLDSTRLWDTYINSFGGEVYSVDIREEAGLKLIEKGGKLSPHTHLYVGDSVPWLKQIGSTIGRAHEREKEKMTEKEAKESIDVWFLDSCDVDWNEPDSAAFHGFAELMAILDPSFKVKNLWSDRRGHVQPSQAHKKQVVALTLTDFDPHMPRAYLKPGALIWIDDTPKSLAVWESVQGSGWHAMNQGRDGSRREYNETTSTLAHMNITGGILPGKGSFAMHSVLDRFPERFELVSHGYSVLYRVK